ncbi:conserved exported hypothetical protein [Planktothrix serta PCC 8927]|uniref:Uncharacterized protein n=1 Tax=Planktothrix serta PCC 8927 TaxID=671068 RepID=A0A7Z9C2I2_9CYAN|nr:hypothetical protein [Planktothrix serta]VXD24385.1 conserved exported hypothetical protein [Planktothrix serta PCC 8927]
MTNATLKNLALGVVIMTVGLLLPRSVQAQPFDSASTPMFENITLNPKFSPNPLLIRGLSGGPALAQDTAGREDTQTGTCMGYVDQQPDHTLILTSFFDYLKLQVQSSEDTVLVIRGPGGSWCSDDSKDMNPSIEGQWLSGKYEIWVGSYKPNTYHPYIIQITDKQ